MRTSRLILWSMIAAGCSSGRAESSRPRGPQPFAANVRVESERAALGRTVVFAGTCDASGAVPIDARLFAVADDENNVLRIYDAEKGGAPLYAVDVSPELQLTKKKKYPESDLEAATRLGDVALWLSSHARSKKGKEKPDRLRYFSTVLPRPGQPITLTGPAYSALLDDLLADPRLTQFGLQDAADKPPQAPGGLNIEGITAMPNGHVLLGFRNPVPDRRALLVAIVNPLDPFSGKPARFDAPIRLDLGGLGVRSLSYWRGKYLIAAGHYGDGGERRLYEWAGPGTAPRERAAAPIADLNPEAFFTPEQRDEFMLLSDDGSLIIDGERCKDLEEPNLKRFRGAWMRLDRE
jgi:hypothetical protein